MNRCADPLDAYRGSGPPAAARCARILYSTTDAVGVRAVASALVIAPIDPPSGPSSGDLLELGNDRRGARVRAEPDGHGCDALGRSWRSKRRWSAGG
jgi:hypothetical protein